MSILFVLLTFLLLISITYFRRHGAETAVQVQAPRPPAPQLNRELGFEIPKGYAFHPGHTWVLDEGRQNARIGLDSFAANLLGKVERIEIGALNRWVRQGQKLLTLTREGMSIDLLSNVLLLVPTYCSWRSWTIPGCSAMQRNHWPPSLTTVVPASTPEHRRLVSQARSHAPPASGHVAADRHRRSRSRQ